MISVLLISPKAIPNVIGPMNTSRNQSPPLIESVISPCRNQSRIGNAIAPYTAERVKYDRIASECFCIRPVVNCVRTNVMIKPGTMTAKIILKLCGLLKSGTRSYLLQEASSSAHQEVSAYTILNASQRNTCALRQQVALSSLSPYPVS